MNRVPPEGLGTRQSPSMSDHHGKASLAPSGHRASTMTFRVALSTNELVPGLRTCGRENPVHDTDSQVHNLKGGGEEAGMTQTRSQHQLVTGSPSKPA